MGRLPGENLFFLLPFENLEMESLRSQKYYSYELQTWTANRG